ncbi:MAG TPA: hypothetical protein VKE70_23950 [Candidatus Solibacter sp.]|nr:hypothetical protein [Candidatus Solibacter sp.]
MKDELSRPGYRRYIEKRADGSMWQVEEHAHSVHGLLLHQYSKAWKIAHNNGLPLPPLPPELEEADTKDVVCVTRCERRVGVRWKEADGRVFEQDENGMVFAVDSQGQRIIDPKFRRRRRRTNGQADE